MNSGMDEFASLVEQTYSLAERAQTDGIPSQNSDFAPDFLLENANLLLASKDYELARHIFRTLVSKSLNVPAGLLGLAKSYEIEENWGQAERYFREALAYNSTKSIYQSLISSQILQGKDREAVKTGFIALSIKDLSKTERFEIEKILGNCLTRLGEYEQAKLHFEKAYEINPDSDSLQVCLGNLALQKGELKNAQIHYQRSLELNEVNSRAVLGLGMVYSAANKPAMALEYFEKASQLDPQDLLGVFNLVRLAYQCKTYEPAIRALRSHIAVSKGSNANIHYSLAGLLFQAGRDRESSQEVTMALQLEPQHQGSTELLHIMKNQGRFYELNQSELEL